MSSPRLLLKTNGFARKIAKLWGLKKSGVGLKKSGVGQNVENVSVCEPVGTLL